MRRTILPLLALLFAASAPCLAEPTAPAAIEPPPAGPAQPAAAAEPTHAPERVDSEGIVVPEGYVLQVLGATDGRIAMPKGWFYDNHATPSGWSWTFSVEDPRKGGGFETGLTIQMFVQVQEKTHQPREAFARKFIEEKRHSGTLVHDCPVQDFPEFRRQCIEVVEDLPSAAGTKRFHVLYSMMWLKNMDIVALSTFGAPPEKWDAVSPVTEVMAAFVLIGKSPGNTN
jgi:hypothetical protein